MYLSISTCTEFINFYFIIAQRKSLVYKCYIFYDKREREEGGGKRTFGQAKFACNQTRWMSTPNNSFVPRCWVNCCIVRSHLPTLLVMFVRSRLCFESTKMVTFYCHCYCAKCWKNFWVKYWSV